MKHKRGWKVYLKRNNNVPTFSAKPLGIRLVLYSRNELRDTEQEWIAVSATGVTNSRGKLFWSFLPRNRNDIPARVKRERERKRCKKSGVAA